MSNSQAIPSNDSIEIITLTSDAIKNSKLDDLRVYLEKGRNPNLQDAEGNTALHLAAKANKENIVKMLLKFGADPDIKNKKDEKPAFYATYFNPELKDNPIAKLLESMSTAISALFGTSRAMKQADFMLESKKPEEIEKIVTFKHLSSDLLKAIVIRAAKDENIDLVAVLNNIMNTQTEAGKLNFLQDSGVVSKICDRLKTADLSSSKENIINKLQDTNAKDRTVNFEMLEQAKKKSKPGSSSKFSSLWHGTIEATKKEVRNVKEAISKARTKK
jgi:hypothetical protein